MKISLQIMLFCFSLNVVLAQSENQATKNQPESNSLTTGCNCPMMVLTYVTSTPFACLQKVAPASGKPITISGQYSYEGKVIMITNLYDQNFPDGGSAAAITDDCKILCYTQGGISGRGTCPTDFFQKIVLLP